MSSSNSLLQSPSLKNEFEAPKRAASTYNPLDTFELPKGSERKYAQQYADIYFVRLAVLKRFVEEIAQEAWGDFEIAGEKARRVDRVLDVRQGELCWVVGTVYMEMALKPSILDDLSKEHWIISPIPRDKYVTPGGGDQVMLEDESGRLQLTGAHILSQMLCTGCIVAVIGTENADGSFEVIDVKVPDLPRQPTRWEHDDRVASSRGQNPSINRCKSGKIGIVSGLALNGTGGDTVMLDLLAEYLLGEAGNQEEALQISRLIIAGNSLTNASPIPSRQELAAKKSEKKYAADPSSFNSSPGEQLDQFLASLLPSIPITLIPGASDPANVSLPQQPLHPALFPRSRTYTKPHDDTTPGPSWFDSATNPWEASVNGWRLLGTGGQPVDDMFKYTSGDSRLEMMEQLLRWRNSAPTAPDTLWAYPFQDKDPFLLKECPHVYLVGNQPRFETNVIVGPDGESVRLIALPKFRETGELILLDSETLEVECVKFDIYDPNPIQSP